MRVNWLLLIMRMVVVSSLLLISTEAVWAEGKKDNVVIAAVIYGKHNVTTLDGFKEGMKEKGYIEGKNTIYLFHGTFQNLENLDADIAKVVSENPDLIFASTTPVALAVKKATSNHKIPVVFGPVNDPMSAGVVAEQRHPGDNITGVMLTDSIAKQLEWAIRIAPRIKKILLPYNPNDKSSVISVEKAREAAELFKLTLDARQVSNHKEIDILLAEFPDDVGAIFLPRDGMVMSRVEDFAKVANQKKIILSGTRLEMAERGALFGFGFNGFMVGKQMARMADQILRGRKPGDLPVETAEDYLSINLKTANTLGITISEHILRQAHTIIRAE
ncbi:ABC transporter substrate-binding protein [Desulfopila aestuarii]|nr:ABC transporter substrate-binding protein [Desulfopila aestuarii]